MNTHWKLAKPGIYKGLTREQYESIPAVNQSTLKLLKPTAMHGKYAIEHPRESSEQMQLGSAAHACILEPGRVNSMLIQCPDVDRRKKEGKEAWAAFQEQANGKTVLQASDMNSVRLMVENVRNHPTAGGLLRKQKAREVCVVWVDALTGMACKALLDLLTIYGPFMAVVDLKSTRDASERAFSKDIYGYGYHIQAAFYLDGLNALAAVHRPYLFICVENEPPHCVAVYELDEESIEAGRLEYQRLLQMYAECTKSGEWPGYSKDVNYIGIPHWALKGIGINE